MVKFRFLYLALIAILTIILLSTCRNKEIEVSELILSESELSLNIGETVELIASIKPENATDQNIIWRSSNINVASVNNGFVTAKTSGTTVITATTERGNHTASCTIFVSFPILRIVQLCDPQLGFGNFNSDVVNL